MKTIDIYAVGRLREASFRTLCDDYYQRCRKRYQVRETVFKSVEQVGSAIELGTLCVVLDERGVQWTSREFATQLARWMSSDAKKLVFLIGGADGVSPSIRHRATALLSLGKMTFAHKMVRVMLAEQLYRAVSILDGDPYHRD